MALSAEVVVDHRDQHSADLLQFHQDCWEHTWRRCLDADAGKSSWKSNEDKRFVDFQFVSFCWGEHELAQKLKQFENSN